MNAAHPIRPDLIADVDEEAVSPQHGQVSADAVLRYISAAGSALICASAPSSTVGPGLRELAHGYGVEVNVVALPETVLAVDERTGRSSLARARTGSFRFDQTERLFDLIMRSRTGTLSPEQGRDDLRSIELMPPTIPAVWRFVGYCLIAVGLCLLQTPRLTELAVTAAFSLPIAALVMATPKLPGFAPFAPGVVAFLVGLPVSLLVSVHFLVEPSNVVVPLLSSFLPGLLLAVGSLELIHGALQAGAARLMGGIFQLILLAFGLIASQAAFTLSAPTHVESQTAHIGSWSPLVGVGVYVLGIWLAFCAPPSAVPALAMVIFLGWGIQQLSDEMLGPYASTFLGAAVAVVVVQVIHTRSGPPPLLTLNPLFRILTPGGLSLLRVTSVTSGNFVGANLGVVVFTLISVAMGLAAGMAIAERFGLREV
jgi:uncharacterized membrane protein YjjP (DUF1212 family)/uncharacterized membrane protein YjjB (DUF3815 family)